MIDVEKESLEDKLGKYYSRVIDHDLIIELEQRVYEKIPDKYKNKDYAPSIGTIQFLGINDYIRTIIFTQVAGISNYYYSLPYENKKITELTEKRKNKIVDESISQYQYIDYIYDNEESIKFRGFYPPIFSCNSFIYFISSELHKPVIMGKYFHGGCYNYDWEMVISMLGTAKTILFSVESEIMDFTSAHVLLRTLFETYAKFDLIAKNKEYHDAWQAIRHLNGINNKETKQAEIEKYKGIYPNIEIALNKRESGWINLVTQDDNKTYYFDDVVDLANIPADQKEQFKRIYKEENFFVHGAVKNYQLHMTDIIRIVVYTSLILVDIGKYLKEKLSDNPDFVRDINNIGKYMVDRVTESTTIYNQSEEYWNGINNKGVYEVKDSSGRVIIKLEWGKNKKNTND